MVWAHKQSGSTEASNTTIVLTLGSNVTAGDLITVMATSQSSQTITSVTDGGSNTYITSFSEAVTSPATNNLYTYYAIATTGGFNTITVGVSSAVGETTVIADEWSFTPGGVSVVGNSVNNNTSGSLNPTSGNVSWTNGPVLLWNAVASNSASITGFTAGSGFTLYGTKTGVGTPGATQAALNLPATMSAINCACSMTGTSHPWASIGVAFQSSGDVYLQNAAMLLQQQ
jgi:hypothetical protein